MKKCPDCHREVDKYGIICEYCNKIDDSKNKKETSPKKSKETVRK
jgi:hypothetical protein